MVIRILLLLLAFVILTNIIISIIGAIMGINLYKKYGKSILNGYGIFILFIIAVYVIFAILGLI